VAAEVLARPHPDEMKAVAVGADHVWPALERLIGDHAYATLETHGTDGAHGDAETLAHLLRARRAGLGAERARELALVEIVVAAYESENGRVARHVEQALDRAGGVDLKLRRHLGDGPGPGRGDFVRPGVLRQRGGRRGGGRRGGGLRHAAGQLDIGRVV